MRRPLMFVTAMLFGLSAPLAKAETPKRVSEINECSPEAMKLLSDLEKCKPKPKPRKPRRKKPATPPVLGPQGVQGEPGPQGPPGPPGPTKVVYVPVPQPQPFKLRLAVGLIGSALFPEKQYAWAWGPAIQLQFYDVGGRSEIDLTVGFAGGFDGLDWSPGRTRAWLIELGYTSWRTDHFGLTLGGHAQWIGTKPNWEHGMYVGFVPGIAAQTHLWKTRWRFDAKPFLGMSSYQTDGDGAFSFGVTSTLTVTWK